MKKAAVPLILVVVVLLALGVIADAQQQAKIPKIGRLVNTSLAGGQLELEQALGALGYVEGKNIAIEYRYADNKLDRLLALAEELVGLKVDVLVVPTTPAVLALRNATRTIPIVFFSVAGFPIIDKGF
jgi:putative ABC transport system substrate-binding protein